ncbi:MAG: ParB/RepB/Spo0J family partition protein [Chloroflexi bacterium]|nr:ParB/RepB/Spo0J family partition protein [Chloroflexota bacterium]
MANNSPASVLKKAANALKGNTNTPGQPAFVLPDRATPKLIRLANIELDPDQPRKDIGDVSDLVTSITEHGLLNALVVRPIATNRYCIVAGERRYHACKRVGLDVVQCIVRTPNQQQTIELQLVENLHRKDLDAFEEAYGYARLKTEHNYTDETIAKKMAKSRTHVTQTLSLGKIPDEVRALCQRADIALSRDTLYLIAKQPALDKMLAVLRDAQNGVPRDQRRAKARKGEARETTTPKKPKWAYSSTDHKVTVVVQSHNSTLTKERRIDGLKEALKEAEAS